MMAIIEYDHSTNISPEQRLKSLADSVRRAFEELESEEQAPEIKDCKPVTLEDLGGLPVTGGTIEGSLDVKGSLSVSKDGKSVDVYNELQLLLAQAGIDSFNADYPNFTNNWRWVKYKDGTFKAEYKETITTDTLMESTAISDIKVAYHTVALPFTAIQLDVPKWGVRRSTGIIIVTGRGEESLDSISVTIARVISSSAAYSLTLGCTVTGVWNESDETTSLIASWDEYGNVTIRGAAVRHDGAGNVTIVY